MPIQFTNEAGQFPSELVSTWDELKKSGSNHYKTGGVEPIDLYLSKRAFKPFALCNIVKYATRNIDKDLNPADIHKIIHYCNLILAANTENKL